MWLRLTAKKDVRSFEECEFQKQRKFAARMLDTARNETSAQLYGGLVTMLSACRGRCQKVVARLTIPAFVKVGTGNNASSLL